MGESCLKITETDGVSVVRFHHTSILDTLTVQRISRELYGIIEGPRTRHVVLDFQDVRFLSSQALGVLLTLRRKADKLGAQVAFCGLSPELLRVFQMTKLDKLFPIFASNEAALAHLGPARAGD